MALYLLKLILYTIYIYKDAANRLRNNKKST